MFIFISNFFKNAKSLIHDDISKRNIHTSKVLVECFNKDLKKKSAYPYNQLLPEKGVGIPQTTTMHYRNDVIKLLETLAFLSSCGNKAQYGNKKIQARKLLMGLFPKYAASYNIFPRSLNAHVANNTPRMNRVEKKALKKANPKNWPTNNNSARPANVHYCRNSKLFVKHKYLELEDIVDLVKDFLVERSKGSIHLDGGPAWLQKIIDSIEPSLAKEILEKEGYNDDINTINQVEKLSIMA